MSRHLKTQSLSLAELLRSRRTFVLPATQRAYGWGEDQLIRLFADAGCMLSGGSMQVIPPTWLFLGTVYLADLPDGTTAIADGQQRIVTGMMIYAAARDLEPLDSARRVAYAETVTPGPEGAAPRLSLRDVDAAFFRRWVLEPGAMLRPFQHDVDEADTAETDEPAVVPLSESQTNMLTNRGVIVETMRALPPDQRRTLLSVFEQATEVVAVTAPSVADALNAYASTHKRGLRQSETDRLKFEIVGDAAPETRRVLANHWDECESRIGKDALLDLCGYLLQNKTGQAPPADVLTGLVDGFVLPERVAPFVLDTLTGATEAYAQVLARGTKLTAWLNPGLTERARARRIQGHLATLMRTSHDEWRGAAVAALQRQRSNLSLLDETLAGLERMASIFMIVGLDTHTLCKRYGLVSAAIQSNEHNVIRSALGIERDLKSRAKDLLASAKFAEKPRYRTPVLLKLNDLMAGDVSIHAVESVSAEHVLPQNVSRSNTAWRQVFRSANGSQFTGQHFRHRLGNLTLLSHEQNREAADKPYGLKRRLFAQSEFALTRDITQRFETWTPQTVEARTADLLGRLVRHWEL